MLWSAAAAAAAAALVLLGAGCTPMQQSDKAAGAMGTSTATQGVGADKGMNRGSADLPATARAQLKTPEGTPAGMATLTSVQGGVDIALQVQGMKPGPHGFHIHDKGDCAPGMDAATGKTVAFGAAGGHFDPHGTKTHGRPDQPSRQSHAGDAPNLVVGANGSGTLRHTSTQVTLTPGADSIVGRALVVHESEDDYKTNPAGNAGARIACGVIELTQNSLMDRSNMAQKDMPAVGQTPTR